ncbi:6-phosphogluconate dehydrogenase (decarboxylating) [bacterium]|nr:6-phosphogluconate dehydrogenase (decarboxylating) [bacterium]|tara:strand:- start:3095 stop:3994 length:900 start_codon:yes stop_codon:yes gene_type:complete
MQVGLIGVGKMGGGILRRWQKANHEVVAHDPGPDAGAVITDAGGTVADSVAELVQSLTAPRVIWLMVPAGDAVSETIQELAKQLDPGDTVIDGGNSQFRHSVQNAQRLGKRDIHFIDVGVSGGVAGEEIGYALMVGADAKHLASVQALLDDLAADDAFAHVGPVGAGHYVKMIHNAVEYGMMQSIGEGFDLLKNGSYDDLDLEKIARLWSKGTIIRSFLIELAHKALANDSDLADIAGYVDDNGEGRWSVKEAVDNAVPFSVNTAALYARFESRLPDTFSAKLIAALRNEFGGHKVKKK